MISPFTKLFIVSRVICGTLFSGEITVCPSADVMDSMNFLNAKSNIFLGGLVYVTLSSYVSFVLSTIATGCSAISAPSTDQ